MSYGWFDELDRRTNRSGKWVVGYLVALVSTRYQLDDPQESAPQASPPAYQVCVCSAFIIRLLTVSYLAPACSSCTVCTPQVQLEANQCSWRDI